MEQEEAVLAGKKSGGFILSAYRLEENVCGYYFGNFVLYKFVCWVFVGNLCEPGPWEAGECLRPRSCSMAGGGGGR